jgi:hypothetical protein
MNRLHKNRPLGIYAISKVIRKIILSSIDGILDLRGFSSQLLDKQV